MGFLLLGVTEEDWFLASTTFGGRSWDVCLMVAEGVIFGDASESEKHSFRSKFNENLH